MSLAVLSFILAKVWHAHLRRVLVWQRTIDHMKEERCFSDTWQGLVRVLVVGILAYAGLVFFLRLSGKHTLPTMNAFDFVVMVALGSTLATILLSAEVALAEGLLAFAVLITLQYILAWSPVHWPSFRRVVKSDTTLLLYQGHMLHDAMRRERVVAGEIIAAIRASGVGDIHHVEAAILETDGTFSVMHAAGSPSGKYRAGRRVELSTSPVEITRRLAPPRAGTQSLSGDSAPDAVVAVV